MVTDSKLAEITAYLDGYLGPAAVPEAAAVNGLQVQNSGSVTRLAAAVDACEATIAMAAERGAQLLIVHHGLFWGDTRPLVGPTYRRMAALLRHDIAVYASHLPLDRHPEVGNNPLLARLLGLRVRGEFGDFDGHKIGVWGECDLTRDAFVGAVAQTLGAAPRVLAFGPKLVKRVGIVTGAGGGIIGQAAAAGLDTYLTGEGQHWTYFDAEELGVNVIYAGHYATETVGVRALTEHVSRHFGLPWDFLDHPTGM